MLRSIATAEVALAYEARSRPPPPFQNVGPKPAQKHVLAAAANQGIGQSGARGCQSAMQCTGVDGDTMPHIASALEGACAIHHQIERTGRYQLAVEAVAVKVSGAGQFLDPERFAQKAASAQHVIARQGDHSVAGQTA